MTTMLMTARAAGADARFFSTGTAVGLLAFGLIACGDPAAGGQPDLAASDGGADPAGGAYAPFDPNRLAGPAAQVAVAAKIDGITKQMGFGATSFGAFEIDPAATTPAERCTPRIPPAAGTIAAAFLEADLCRELVGRIQRHAYGDGAGTAGLGVAMHARIARALADGAAETDKARFGAHGQWVKKTLVRYFYESIHTAMLARSTGGWDAAYGFWGASLDGTPAAGLAATASGRDAKFKTTFVLDVSRLLREGRGHLAAALVREGRPLSDPASSVAEGASPELDRVIGEIDGRLTLMLAYASGSYFHRWITEVAKRPELFAEGSAFLQSIEDYIDSKDAKKYAAMRAALDKGEAFGDADAALVARTVEEVFGIRTQ